MEGENLPAYVKENGTSSNWIMKVDEILTKLVVLDDIFPVQIIRQNMQTHLFFRFVIEMPLFYYKKT